MSCTQATMISISDTHFAMLTASSLLSVKQELCQLALIMDVSSVFAGCTLVQYTPSYLDKSAFLEVVVRMRRIVSIRDITDKSPENFSGHLVAPDHEFGGISARSVHLKLPEKVRPVQTPNFHGKIKQYPWGRFFILD